MENTKYDFREQRLHSGGELDVNFWNSRWQSGATGWDIGYASPPITDYLSQYKNKDAAILIPGCGNAYEAGYMVNNGFTNITLVDISDVAVSMLKEKFRMYPQINVLCEDFFGHRGNYELILEQTFFCAQVPERRKDYAYKVHDLLREKGKLAGVLFGVDFGLSGPPFGGGESEYRKLFDPLFDIKTMERCHNSILPRAGAEIFTIMIKK